MSTAFYWFEGIDCVQVGEGFSEEYKVVFEGGDSTSHSAGNIKKVQEMLEEYNCCIPYIDVGYAMYPSEPVLVPPADMYAACCKILNSEMKYPDMRERIEWFKKLSGQNYFLAYDGTF